MSSLVPDGWIAAQLGDLLMKIEGGGTPPRDNSLFWDGDIPWATVKDLKGVMLSSTQESISLEGLKGSSCKLIPANTIIIACRMAVGKAVVFDRDVAINQDLKALHPKINTDWRYLIQWYLSKSEYIEGLGTGSTVKGIRLDDLKVLPINLPPLPEQQKIAAILTSVDEVIEKTQAQIDKLKDLKTGMMQELLTKGIEHTEFKDSPVGTIPVDWDVVKVSDVSNVVDSMHLTPSFNNKGKPMVRVTEIRNSEYLDIEGAVTVNDSTFLSFSRNYQPKVGDTLIARVGAYFGATAFIADELEFCLGQNTASIRPMKIKPKYLFIYLNSEAVRSQMEDAVSVGAQPSLSLKAIKDLKVGLPSLKEQDQISNAISSISKNIELAKSKLEAIKHTKKALMQDLLTGKVRVNAEQADTDETAG